MAVELEGGCRVSVMNEGTPEIAGNMKMWRQIGTSTGAKAVSLRIVEFDEGRSPLIRNDEFDEVFYYLESFEEDRQTASQCTVQLDGRSFDLEPETGFLLQAGKVLSVLNPSNAPVVLVGVQCPKSANNKDATSDTAHPPEPPVRYWDLRLKELSLLAVGIRFLARGRNFYRQVEQCTEKLFVDLLQKTPSNKRLHQTRHYESKVNDLHQIPQSAVKLLSPPLRSQSGATSSYCRQSQACPHSSLRPDNHLPTLLPCCSYDFDWRW